MTRVLALLVTLFPAVTLTLAEDQSRPNKSDESNSFNVELPILKQKLSGDRSAPEAPGEAVARLETKLEEAKRDAKGVERGLRRFTSTATRTQTKIVCRIKGAHKTDQRLDRRNQQMAR